MRAITKEWVFKAEDDYRYLCLRLDEDFESIRTYLQSLEHYAVTIRYPGIRIPFELGEEAFKVSSLVRDFVRKKLKVR
jgi:hypothetical protein